ALCRRFSGFGAERMVPEQAESKLGRCWPARAPERARGEPARSTRRGRSTLAPPPRAIVPVRAREFDSTARIRGGGSRSGILATTRRAARIGIRSRVQYVGTDLLEGTDLAVLWLGH